MQACVESDEAYLYWGGAGVPKGITCSDQWAGEVEVCETGG